MSSNCLLSSKPKSFSPNFSTTDTNSNLFLLPLKNSDGFTNNILMLHGTQVVLFDSRDLTVKEEILLESRIDSFKFDSSTQTLTISLSSKSIKDASEFYSDDSDNSVDNTVSADADNTETVKTDTQTLNTITSKNCTWTLPTSLFSLNFSSNQLTCSSATDPIDKSFYHCESPIFEVIKDDHVACITENQLKVLSITNRRILSNAPITPSETRANSLIWIDDAIFVFSVDSGLKVLKFPLMQFATPTNGCNWPLINWSEDTINVHRAGAICPTWYKLKNSQVWDVLKSPIGVVNHVTTTTDGSCLLVCGSLGVAFCDFFSRTWHAVPFPSLKHPKWLGSSHVVALTPDSLQLILINRKSDDIMTIPIVQPEEIRFIDTYNNWQLLIQKSDAISIFAFDSETTNLTLIKTVPFTAKTNLKQAAYFKETLFILDENGKFLINDKSKSGNYESFLVLSTGHLLLVRTDSNGSVLLKDDQEIELGFSPWAVLPFTNCFTVLTCEFLNFSLNSQISSKFLLPELFLSSKDPKILEFWFDDPLFPLALEYILLGALGKFEILELLSNTVTDKVTLSKAIVSLTRKIEVQEASKQLFPHLLQFQPLKIIQTLSLTDNLNFLPYLAKSYSEPERKDAIISILDEMFSKRRYHDKIRKVKEFLSAFDELEDLFESVLQNKIEKLWKSGRLIKAFELSKFTGREIKFTDVFDDSLKEYLRLDSAVSKVDLREFRSWLETQSLSKSIDLLNTLFP